MSKTISIRVAPQTGRKFAGQRRHDLRDKLHIPGYVDQERIDQNSVLIEPPDPSSLRKEIAANRKAAGQQALRADAGTSIAGIITFGTEAQAEIEELDRDKQDRLFLSVAQAISRETGHELRGLVVHRDESAVHAHFTLRGYRLDEQGREQAWRKGRAEMSRLQDIAAQVPEVAALGIERGIRKAEREARGEDQSKTVHRSVRELHRDLPRDLEAARENAKKERDALEEELADQRKKAEKNRRLIQEQEAKLEDGRVKEEQAKKRIDAYERRERDALDRIKKLEGQIVAKGGDLAALDDEIKSRKDTVENLKKLEIDAAARVAQLGQDETAAQERLNALVTEIDVAAKAITEKSPLPEPPEIRRFTWMEKAGIFSERQMYFDGVSEKDFNEYVRKVGTAYVDVSRYAADAKLHETYSQGKARQWDEIVKEVGRMVRDAPGQMREVVRLFPLLDGAMKGAERAIRDREKRQERQRQKDVQR